MSSSSVVRMVLQPRRVENPDENPDDVVMRAEHPRMKSERENVRDLSETTSFHPEGTAKPRLCMDRLTMGLNGRNKCAGIPSIRSRSLNGRMSGTFGQDAASMNRIEGDGLVVVTGTIADGHGMEGEKVSRHCNKDLFTRTEYRDLMDQLLLGKSDEVRETLRLRFLALDEEACKLTSTGGSTLSVWMILQDVKEGRIFLVTANVGDSPILLIRASDGRVGEMATMHSWDSIKERRIHNEACKNADQPVPIVIYSRANTNHHETFPDTEGEFKPVPMFVGSSDVVHEANRDHVVRLYKTAGRVGGIQSRTRKLQRVHRDGRWEDEALEGTGHENYGSTPLEYDEELGMFVGGTQMTRGMGDRRYKKPLHDRIPLMVATPSVSIMEFLGPIHLALVACSDGPGDILYSSEFGEKVSDYARTHKDGDAQGLADHLLSIVEREGAFFFGEPNWDDLSLTCTMFHVVPSK